MATILQTPAVCAITPFDPGHEQVIEFYYTDNQPCKNRLVITDNETGRVVYDKTVESMRLCAVLPGNILSPGKQYLAQIQVFDYDNNHSNLSEPVLFYCLASPRFRLLGYQNGDILRSAAVDLALDYFQPEQERLKSYRFFLYSGDRILLSSSDTFYSSSPQSYAFTGLNNNTVYCLRATGETVHGVFLDTGYVEITVSYGELPSNAVFSVENNYKGGYIQVATNVIIIGYRLKNDNYRLADGALTLEDNYLLYHSGFRAADDFSLFVEAKQLPPGKFLTTGDDGFSLHIVTICGTRCCKLTIGDSDTVCCVPLPIPRTENVEDKPVCPLAAAQRALLSVPPQEEDASIVFEVKRIGGIYSLHTYYRKDPQEVTI